MPVILWTIIALALVAGAIAIAANQTRSIVPPLDLPPGETLPATPVQRLVRWALLVGLILMTAAGVVIAAVGPIQYFDDDTVRLAVTALLIASLFVLAAPSLVAGIWAARGAGVLDERDRAILARAPAGQAGAILVVLAVWMIALQETYRGEAGIPHVYLYLVFWSCLLVSLVASNVGILLGYRRS
jgi:hypothetical protein